MLKNKLFNIVLFFTAMITPINHMQACTNADEIHQYQKRLFKFRTAKKLKKLWIRVRKLRKKNTIKIQEALEIKKDLVHIVKRLTGVKMSDKKLRKIFTKAINAIKPGADVSIFDPLFPKMYKKSINRDPEVVIPAKVIYGGVALFCSALIAIIPVGCPPAAIVCWPLSQWLAVSGGGSVLLGLCEMDENKTKSLVLLPEIPFPEIDDAFEFEDPDFAVSDETMQKVCNFSEIFNIGDKTAEFIQEYRKSGAECYDQWGDSLQDEICDIIEAL